MTAPSKDRILWAALHAMVNDIHSPQDNLTGEEWAEAEWMLRELDVKIHNLSRETLVWLVWKITREQYGEEGLVGVYSTRELAAQVVADLPGEQTRIEEVKVL
jgi:hypothetical protein